MKIAGLQKMTLLDFPGKVACTVFLGGCNFRCPYCHNSELLDGTNIPVMDDAQLLTFLEKRKGLLDGVCITGGEPTGHKELPNLLARIKQLGYAVKLDTNGYRPEVLKELLDLGVVDYVAMDIKNGPEHYAATVGLERFDLSRIEESIRILTRGKVSYEFRTTVVDELHSEESIARMGQWLCETAGAKIPKLYLQSFVDRDTVMFAGLHAPECEKMAAFLSLLTPFCEAVEIRGRD